MASSIGSWPAEPRGPRSGYHKLGFASCARANVFGKSRFSTSSDSEPESDFKSMARVAASTVEANSQVGVSGRCEAMDGWRSSD